MKVPIISRKGANGSMVAVANSRLVILLRHAASESRLCRHIRIPRKSTSLRQTGIRNHALATRTKSTWPCSEEYSTVLCYKPTRGGVSVSRRRGKLRPGMYGNSHGRWQIILWYFLDPGESLDIDSIGCEIIACSIEVAFGVGFRFWHQSPMTAGKHPRGGNR
jgi:hypothetical protein